MEVFRLLGTIAVNNENANKKIEDTKTKAEGLSSTFSKIGDMTVKFGNTMIKGMGLVGAAWAASVEGSREYRTEMGKLDAAFETNGHSAKAARATYSELNAVLGNTSDAVEAANHLAALCKNQEELQTWTNISTGVFARWGASLPIQNLAEAANETAKVGTVVGGLADALNWAGVSEDEFNKKLAASTSEQERQQLIMQTLNDLYSDAAESYRTNNKEIIDANRAQGDLTDTMSKIGEYTEPAMTKLKNAVTDMVDVALPYLKSFMEWTEEHGEATAAAIMAIATSMAIAAATAHPYAAAVTAIVAALALMKERNADGDAYNHFFNQYSDEDLAVLQKWVDAVNEAKRAEAAYANDMNNQSLADAFVASQEKMEAAFKDANAIEGLIATYNAWRSGQAENAGSDMYLDVPLRVSDDSEDNVQSEIDGMTLDGIVKLLPDESAINAALSYTRTMNVQMSPTVTPAVDGSHAGGLDRVPRDGYIARVHKDEAILDAGDASIWRSGGSGRIEALLSELVGLTRAGQVIQLDSGIMAGQLTPAIDAQMGTIARNKGRGN